VAPLACDALNDFQTGFDKVDLDFITGSGLVASAYAEVAIGSNGFPARLSACGSFARVDLLGARLSRAAHGM